MTLPASGNISLAQVNTELLLPSTSTISLNDTLVRFLASATTPGTPVSMNALHGTSYIIPSNSGVLTGGSSYTLPDTSGPYINVLVIAGGGGGGGGTGRVAGWSGYDYGGDGGGAGGNAYATNIAVTPGQTITFSIGSAGSGGGGRDGIYSSGSAGTPGNDTYISVNGVIKAYATGGLGGGVAPGGSTAAGGSATTGSALLSSTAGGSPAAQWRGGDGGKGYSINTTVNTAVGSILTYGSSGTGANGAYGSAGGAGGYAASPGTTYGGGGGAGGAFQGDRCFECYCNAVSAAGSAGAVFIWWGY